MIVSTFEHRSGLRVAPREIVDEIKNIFADYPEKLVRQNASATKKDIKNRLKRLGWTGEFRLSPESQISITSYKNNIGLCFQTGNVGRVYADLLKLQTLYIKGNIQVGIMLIPHGSMSSVFGYNCASYERLIKELDIFSQVITMPLIIIGFEETEV